MTQAVDPTALLELEIFHVIRQERFARDQGRWDDLAAYFTDDSFVKTTWFEGTGADFATRSKEMADGGRHSKHPIWPIWARVQDSRALSESYAQIQNRSTIDGVEVDMVQYCRFFSQFERIDGAWKIKSFEAIYQKDTIAPVNPADAVPIAPGELAQFRSSYRIWAWAMEKRGYSVSAELLGDDRPDLVDKFYLAMNAWLANGTVSSSH